MFSEITPRIAVASAYDAVPPDWEKLDVRGLIDGWGNAATLIDSYVREGLAILSKPGGRLLVVCDYGQSRSNFIAAKIYADLEHVSFDEALHKLRTAHPDSDIKRSLLEPVGDASAPPGFRRIAVSGGSGMLGQRLCEYIGQSGRECHKLSRVDQGEYLCSSVALGEACGGLMPDLFVHYAHPKPYNAELASQVAFAQLVTVANFCQDNNVALLYPSSWVVFDGSTESQVTSSSSVRAHTRYGRLKAACECFLAQAAANGLNVRILRLPAVFGPDSLDPRFLRYFAECGMRGKDIVFHQFENGSARVPLAHIDGVCTAVSHALEQFQSLPLISQVATSAQSPSVEEIACSIASEFGLKAIGTPVPRKAFAGHFVADIAVGGEASSFAGIKNFIRQISRECPC